MWPRCYRVRVLLPGSRGGGRWGDEIAEWTRARLKEGTGMVERRPRTARQSGAAIRLRDAFPGDASMWPRCFGFEVLGWRWKRSRAALRLSSSSMYERIEFDAAGRPARVSA
eukprot:5672711-Pyramimonas_sp.AAC.1